LGAHNIGYTSHELETITGVNRKTIHDWTYKGLLMPPVGSGSGRHTHYTDDHVRRIEAIKDLKDGIRTNRDIRDYFNPEDDDDDL
jgi:DNA-binding transcriptional MerR regulator